jgi:hypothetical protein
MSRISALWISAILTLAFVLVVGTILLRPSSPHSVAAQSQPATTVLDAGAGQVGVSEQPVTGEYQDDHHDDYEHSEQHEEHDDDD